MNNRIKDIVNNADIEYQNWILNNSYKNVGVNGLHIITLYCKDECTTRVYITDEKHELTSNNGANCIWKKGVDITVLKGYIHHRLYTRTNKSFPHKADVKLIAFRWINNKFEKLSFWNPSFDVNLSVLHEKSYIRLNSVAISEIYCLQQVNAWLISEFKDDYATDIVFSYKDISNISKEGYYNKFESFDEIKHYINML